MSATFAGGYTLGAQDVVIFGPLRLWAERGLIHIEDERDNSYESVSVRMMLRRMKAIQDMLLNTTHREMYTEDTLDSAERMRHQRWLEAMLEVTTRAQVQGMPTDKSARGDLQRSMPKTFVVPGFGGGM